VVHLGQACGLPDQNARRHHRFRYLGRVDTEHEDGPNDTSEAIGDDLTPRQQRFVEEYLVDLNGTQAAIRAGYSRRTAEVSASRLLRKAKVFKVVTARKSARAEAAGITEERVLRELNALAFSDVSHYQQNPITGVLELAPGAPPNAMAAVSSVEYETRSIGGEDGEAVVLERKVKFKLWDKPGSVRLAGRYKNIHGFFNKIEVTGKDGKDLIPSRSDAVAALKAVVGPGLISPTTDPPTGD